MCGIAGLIDLTGQHGAGRTVRGPWRMPSCIADRTRTAIYFSPASLSPHAD